MSLKTLFPLLIGFSLFLSGCATTPPAAKLSPQEQSSLLLDQARSRYDASRRAGDAIAASRLALSVATDRSASALDRTRAMHTYNAALEILVQALAKQGHLPRGTFPVTIQGADGSSYQLRITSSGNAVRNPADFDKLVATSTIHRRHLRSDIQRSGLGATFLGVQNDPARVQPNRPPIGFTLPLTAIARFQPSHDGSIPVTLTFLDPREQETVTLDRSTFQLRGDFTASLAYFPPIREVLFGILAMFRSDLTMKRSGIFMIEPYDPNKIPVLFVHGLMSSPQAFINLVNDLDADPSFRRRYQPWVFFYPTGGPIAVNALRFRKDLAELSRHYPLKHNIVVIGHSMGGILTNMQVINTTRRQLWNSVFGANSDHVYASLPPDSIVKQALIFQASPYISRVIFIATPHRGSNLADLTIASFAGSFIRMPAQLVSQFTPELRSAVSGVAPQLRTIPTSIIGLSPRNTLLKGINQIPITVPYHSIIGNRGQNDIPLAQSSDGIVPYWSSHLDGAQSEVIVPTGHDAFHHPDAAREILRILALKK